MLGVSETVGEISGSTTVDASCSTGVAIGLFGLVVGRGKTLVIAITATVAKVVILVNTIWKKLVIFITRLS
jgi:hypothetical protein